MFINFWKIAIRNLKRQKIYSIVNICGLSLALTVAVFSILFVSQEISFNKFDDSNNSVYRIVTVFGEGMRQEGMLSESPARLKSILTEQVPDIQAYTRIKAFEVPVKNENNSFKETIFFAENDFFDIFSFDLLAGNIDKVLNAPDEVVISSSISKKYFGIENPIGKTLSIYFSGTFHDFTVTGIVEDAPGNSSVQHNLIFSYQWLINWNPGQYDLNEWAPNVFNFVKVDKSAGTTKQLNNKVFSAIDQARGTFYEERGFSRNAVTYELLPVSDMHLETGVRNWPNTVLLGPAPSNILYSYILISIAALVLIIACINYTTYSIGYSLYRGKEVGVRKTLGAERVQIMAQFWIETLILTFISLSFGLMIVQLLLPTLNSVLGLNLLFTEILQPKVSLMLFLLWLLVSFLAASYPSLVFSGFQPQRVLKGLSLKGSGQKVSQTLVGVQFIGVLVLIISLITIFKQLNHIRESSFKEKDNEVLVIKNQRDTDTSYLASYEQIKSELNSKGLNSITASFGAVNDDLFMMGYNRLEGEEMMYARAFITDYNYLDIHKNIVLKEGRFYSQDFTTDQDNAIVVNEAFVKEMGINEPVGKELSTNAGAIQNEEVQIIGVVKDFHFESFHEQIKPAVFLPLRENVATRYIYVSFPTENTEQVLDVSRQAWSAVHPGLPFEYSFLDQRYEQFYQSEERWKNITKYATVLGIIISLMGIVALTGLTANTRKKEIGIRKILGASQFNLIMIIGRQFLISISLAFLVAAPLSYLLMNQWLQNFAYSVNIGAMPFIIAAATIFIITFLTFTIQAMNTTRLNPVNSLRTE